MLNLVNITQARNNFGQLVSQIVATQNPAVIIRESMPQVVIIPYTDYVEPQENNQEMWRKKILQIKGDWISLKNQKQIRKSISLRLSKNEI